METQWREYEVREEELSSLAEEIQKKILQNKSLEHLPYYGLLYSKDKIWQGKVFCVMQTRIAAEGSKEDRQSCFYLFESDTKMHYEDTCEDARIEHVYAVFDLCGGDNNQCLSTVDEKSIQSLSKYISTRAVQHLDSSDNKNTICHFMPLRRDISESIHEYFLGTSFNASCPGQVFLTVLKDNTSEKFKSSPCTVHGYEIRKMALGETLFAMKHWGMSSYFFKFHFENICKLGLAFGAFPVGSETPVSWAIVSLHGAISALRTLPEHSGKGLAKAIIKNISCEMMKINLIPFGFIEDIKTSVVPVSLFTSMGFEVFRDVTFHWNFLTGPDMETVKIL